LVNVFLVAIFEESPPYKLDLKIKLAIYWWVNVHWCIHWLQLCLHVFCRWYVSYGRLFFDFCEWHIVISIVISVIIRFLQCFVYKMVRQKHHQNEANHGNWHKNMESRLYFSNRTTPHKTHDTNPKEKNTQSFFESHSDLKDNAILFFPVFSNLYSNLRIQ